MATDLSMANNKIIHLASPTDANDVINKSYVDTQTNNLLKTDGIKSMSADLSMATKKVINLTTSTNGNDAANKSYVDGVKQAATLRLILYTFLIMKWDMIMKRKPNF